MRKYQQMGNATVLSKIFRRTLLIFLLGFIMYWLPFVRTGADGHWEFIPISDTRILGVLQRIALCYCFASLLIHYLPKKALWVVSAVLLLGYWAIMYAFGEPGAPYEIHSNAGLFLDKFVMGDSHLYHGEGFAFDPEGILSTLPAIVNVIAGYLAGLFIQEKGKTPQGITRLISVGAILILIAWLWNTQFPVNK